jgi:uncharacterized protein (TIGR00251 family)
MATRSPTPDPDQNAVARQSRTAPGAKVASTADSRAASVVAKVIVAANTGAVTRDAASPTVPPWLGQASAGRVALSVIVVPQASITRWAGVHDGQLRVRLAAPPVDGKANEELVRFVAGELKLQRRHVIVLRGQTSKRKTLAIDAESGAVLAALIAAGAEEGS